jgi:hypothetical protein
MTYTKLLVDFTFLMERYSVFIMFNKRGRVRMEKKTIEAMINIYCHDQHKTHNRLCLDCSELLGYSKRHLDRCPFQENKTTCANCQVHCYKPTMREKIRAVMRYSGPRMAYKHPLLALFHFIDGFRKEPIRHRSERGW